MVRLLAVGSCLVGIIFGAAIMAFSISSSGPDDTCPKALDAAEVVVQEGADALGLAADLIRSVIDLDLGAAKVANAKLEHLSTAVDGDIDDYRRLADECRGG